MKKVDKIAELNIEATLDNVEKVVAFVETSLKEKDISLKNQMLINIAVDEIFSNIARYAYSPEPGNATIVINIEQEHNMIELVFIDEGVQYDPLRQEDPDVTLSLEERDIGGLGVFMVKKSMDEVVYEYKEGKNILKVRKKRR